MPRTDFFYFFPDEREGERALLAVTRADLRDLSFKPSDFGAFIYRDDYKRIVYRFDRHTADDDVFFLFDDRRGGVIKFLAAYKHKYGYMPTMTPVQVGPLDCFFPAMENRLNDAVLKTMLFRPPRVKRPKLARALSFAERRVTGLIWLIRHTTFWERTIDIWRICP